ncbi:MAG: peptide-methionine (S)-S-oxide reductase MsrA [Candidatus Bathyarchaeota archaeon]|nr:peptide-methionine (S)-S-oxide reductase MsrA [Candidatus Bathyarchaeum tardum]
MKNDHVNNMEVATLGGGCFWCLEAAFEEIRGVVKVESGYSGGTTQAPNYEQVCSGTTGHAEVVQVTFDPATISFKEILEIFFTAHDPTTLNRQGADVGTQYRSVILYHTEKQKEISKRVIEEFEASKVWDNPIVSQVVPFKKFYKAEEYHSKYFAQHPDAGYCKVVIAPKIAKLRKKYREKLKRH